MNEIQILQNPFLNTRWKVLMRRVKEKQQNNILMLFLEKKKQITSATFAPTLLRHSGLKCIDPNRQGNQYNLSIDPPNNNNKKKKESDV